MLWGDFTDLQLIRKAMKGVNRVYFCCPSQGDRLLQAATNVAIAARDEGVRGLVNMFPDFGARARQKPTGLPTLAV